jgi:hypothetical protein
MLRIEKTSGQHKVGQRFAACRKTLQNPAKKWIAP